MSDPSATPQLLSVVADTALNDSDKAITVPAGWEYEIEQLFAQLISTATAGNRQIEFSVLDESSNVLWVVYAGAVQAASLTKTYLAAPNVFHDAAFVGPTVGGVARTGCPKSKLKAGWQVRVRDSAAIDAAADDLTIRGTFQARRVY